MAKLDRILNLLILWWCMLKYWYTAFWGQQSCKTQGRMKTIYPDCVGLVLANAAPGIMHSVATYKWNNIFELCIWGLFLVVLGSHLAIKKIAVDCTFNKLKLHNKVF